jgi:AraC family L-rhamnose operon transcriptional activator RhaR/AraC family L-rhamnose operon regulatory protein RhaS
LTGKLIEHYFGSRLFFSAEFPFKIMRMQHTSQDYNESMRCQREFWKILYVISGHGQEIINDRKYPMSAGNLFIIHPDDKTTFNIESESLEIYNIIFMPSLIINGIKELKSDFDFFAIFGNDFQKVSHEYQEMLYVLDSSKETEQLIRKIEKEYRHEGSNYRNMIKLYLQALLINISRLSLNKVSKKKKENIVCYIEHIIEEHFNEDFNLSILSEKVELTKSHMCRLFKEINGETIMTRLLERRLFEAEKMLKNSKLNISEICFSCGFNNLSYFYRTFTAKNGINPGKYKKKFALY